MFDELFSMLFSSTIKCGCRWPVHPCLLCTGRTDPTAPRDLPDMMSTQESVALLDPCYHPILSFPEGTFEVKVRTEFQINQK